MLITKAPTKHWLKLEFLVLQEQKEESWTNGKNLVEWGKLLRKFIAPDIFMCIYVGLVFDGRVDESWQMFLLNQKSDS